MPGLLPDIDPDGLLEYSVVYTDRSLNHMSRSFQSVMNDLSRILKTAYQARSAIVVPGSGTFGMEAVARQFATDRKCLVIRNGWFSYRWSQIFEMGGIAKEEFVLKARPIGNEPISPYAPAPIEEVVAAIRKHRPGLVFAPHVETSSGMMLPDDYIRSVASAAHDVGALFVLDCIASGAVWVDMRATGVDILVSAPQKGWSGSPCCGLVMLSDSARTAIDATTSSSFACDLKKWLEIMEAYEGGAHAYHATLPTDGLRALRDVMQEAEELGLAELKSRQLELGRRVRDLLRTQGILSVAAPGFEAPGVVVSYTGVAAMKNRSRVREAGLEIAAGVPLMCDEPETFKTFRIGLFGLDKLKDMDRTVATLEQALNRLAD